MPKLSIIVPVYKVEQYIHKCVDSILNQTFTDFELILVDDGSPDNCGKICDEYALLDNRVKVIHQSNAGVSAARNAGLDFAIGQYISFVDSDDYIDINYAQKVVEVIEDTGADIVKFGIIEFSEKKRKLITFTERKVLNNNAQRDALLPLYFKKGFLNIVVWNAVYNRDLALKVRFPVGLINEDNYSSGLYLYYAKKIAFIKEGLYFYRINPDGLSKNEKLKKPLDLTICCAKLHEELRLLGVRSEELKKLRGKIAVGIFQCVRRRQCIHMSKKLWLFLLSNLDLRRKIFLIYYRLKKLFKVV